MREFAGRGLTQAFGTDVGLTRPAVETQRIVGQALDAGYRLLDCALLYGSFRSVCAALKERDLVDDTFIIFKVKPTEISELKGVFRPLGRAPDLLMLHEMAATTAKTVIAMGELANRIRGGSARYLGLSNVSTVEELQTLCEAAQGFRVPVSCVQNRCSPYYQDTEIRRYCREHGIVYLAYGLMGSRQQGACHDEGYGLPTLYLLPTQDPRLEALAQRLQFRDEDRLRPASTGELLLYWASAQGIIPVAFSTNNERVRYNLNASEISAVTTLRAMEVLFSEPRMDGVRATLTRNPPVRALYLSLRDPTAWWLLDEVFRVAGPLLTALAERAGPGSTVALRNMVYNLIRFVGDLQSNDMPWLDMLRDEFRQFDTAYRVTADVDAKRRLFELCYEWLMKDAMAGGGVKEALDRPAEIRGGDYVPDRPVTATGRVAKGQSARLVERPPPVGTLLTLKADDHSTFMEGYDPVLFAHLAANHVYDVSYCGQQAITVRILTAGSRPTARVIEPEE
ncbi:aldo/keto reductase [Corallococcus sp. CA053C]|uniref:aldo/keto reductase n=1 Tax=Corallococcus sp. CA053C TaxID=2316732 RepID=UPI001315827F|nr:aldo/keto reductase [Corallococcus sp. CA053C]